MSEPLKIAFMWQRFLNYHVARLDAAHRRLSPSGHRVLGIEVASSDESYRDVASASPEPSAEKVCLFPGRSYHSLSSRIILSAVGKALHQIEPDLVFAPAAAFPEGMGAIRYRNRSDARCVVMDDAWEHTDRRGQLSREVKKLIHAWTDGVFIPAPSHKAYYQGVGFPTERILYGVDAIDNDWFRLCADRAKRNAIAFFKRRGIEGRYFLFVGRLLALKGVDDLLAAYYFYRTASTTKPWELVLAGAGPEGERLAQAASGLPGVRFLGHVEGEDLGFCYGLAGALVVPSRRDTWSLVTSEGAAAGLPLIVSEGCGAAGNLVSPGKNGWTFPAGDVQKMASHMTNLAKCPPEQLARMGEHSRVMAEGFSLEKFALSVEQAMLLPKRPDGNLVGKLLMRLWGGRVRMT